MSYSLLYKLGEDLSSAPASEAYVERIFSLCCMLTAGRRNRMRQSLEMRSSYPQTEQSIPWMIVVVMRLDYCQC